MPLNNLVKIECPICNKGTPYRVKYEASFNPESLDFASQKTSTHMYFRNVQCSGGSLV